MEVNPLWRGPGNIHGFILDGKSYRLGWATAKTTTVPTVSRMRIITSVLRKYNPFTIACDRWSLVTN